MTSPDDMNSEGFALELDFYETHCPDFYGDPNSRDAAEEALLQRFFDVADRSEEDIPDELYCNEGVKIFEAMSGSSVKQLASALREHAEQCDACQDYHLKVERTERKAMGRETAYEETMRVLRDIKEGRTA